MSDRTLYNSPLLSDVTLYIGRGAERVMIQAHKPILANRSGWFYDHFMEKCYLTDNYNICDISDEMNSTISVALAGIKHVYGLPYHDFESSVQDTAAGNLHDSSDNSDPSDPDAANPASPTSEDETESMIDSQINDAHLKVLLSDEFFTSSPYAYKEATELDKSKLRHHGDVYELAEYFRIPSLAAEITASARQISFESVGKPNFAADLVWLFSIRWVDNSYLEAILAICTENLGLLFKDRQFAQDMLETSPFTARLLLKVLMADSAISKPINLCTDCAEEHKHKGSDERSFCMMCGHNFDFIAATKRVKLLQL